MGIRVSSPGSLVALVEAGSFCVSDPSGDIVDRDEAGATGLFVAERRLLSRLALTLNGAPVVPVDHRVEGPGSATFVARAVADPAGGSGAGEAAPGGAPNAVVVRRRTVATGLRDDVEVRNHGPEPTYVEVEVEVAADLAPVAAARAGAHDDEVEPQAGADDEVLLVRGRGASRVGCRVTGAGAVRSGSSRLRWEAIVPAGGRFVATLVVAPVLAGAEVLPGSLLGPESVRGGSTDRLARWSRHVPQVASDHAGLLTAVRRGASDLGGLRVVDPDVPGHAVIAAGAPWHMALYGRDSLLAAWMSLIVDPELALATVETLARFQGTEADDRTESQPGRILHRLRFGTPGVTPAQIVSFGAVDTTPLFVMLLGELRRWGLAPEVVERLLPHADRALDWITTFGDRDGDGYVEYQRPTDRGERHQAWKDAGDPVRRADGSPARGPLAPAEVQGYTYAAFQARAHFATEAGDEPLAALWRDRAAALRRAFNRDFWVEDAGWCALALDGDKQPVGGLTSNIGHCLWSGIVDEDKAAALAKHLLADDLFSGWGVRTLGASMAAFDPLDPHLGAVWPHDNALCVAGLMRYGFVDEAHRLVLAQLEAAEARGGRMAALAGFDRDDVAGPVHLPDSGTRAWSAAAPFLHLRSLLRFDPNVPQGKLWLSPVLPAAIRSLRVDRIPLLGGSVTVAVEDGEVSVDDLPPGVEVVARPRRPLAAGT
jgi:hypothetical protein